MAAILAIVVLVTAFAVPDESLTGAAFWAVLLITKAVMLASGTPKGRQIMAKRGKSKHLFA